MDQCKAASVRKIAEMYGLGRTKIYELLGSGDIAGRKVGRKTVIIVESVEGWMARQPTYSPRAVPQTR